MRADGRADCAADDGHADTRTDCAADEVTNPSPYEVANPSTLAATERASFSDSDDRSIIRAHASTEPLADFQSDWLSGSNNLGSGEGEDKRQFRGERATDRR